MVDVFSRFGGKCYSMIMALTTEETFRSGGGNTAPEKKRGVFHLQNSLVRNSCNTPKAALYTTMAIEGWKPKISTGRTFTVTASSILTNLLPTQRLQNRIYRS